jgi:hypothetical protein
MWKAITDCYDHGVYPIPTFNAIAVIGNGIASSRVQGKADNAASCHIRANSTKTLTYQVNGDYCRSPAATLTGSSLAENDLSLSSIHVMFARM